MGGAGWQQQRVGVKRGRSQEQQEQQPEDKKAKAEGGGSQQQQQAVHMEASKAAGSAFKENMAQLAKEDSTGPGSVQAWRAVTQHQAGSEGRTSSLWAPRG